MLYIVTVILNKAGKKTDTVCPMWPEFHHTCSAPSGRHHSILLRAKDEQEVLDLMSPDWYVARVESTGDIY